MLKFAVELDTSVVRVTGIRQRQRAILFAQVAQSCTEGWATSGIAGTHISRVQLLWTDSVSVPRHMEA